MSTTNTVKRSSHDRSLYTQEAMTAALNAVQEGKQSVREAASLHGIPRTTLRDRLKGKKPFRELERTALSKAEEDMLVEWLSESAQRGLPKTKSEVLLYVQALMKDDSKSRRRNFRNGMPGSRWFERFLKRHKDKFAVTAPQLLQSKRTTVTDDIAPVSASLCDPLMSCSYPSAIPPLSLSPATLVQLPETSQDNTLIKVDIHVQDTTTLPSSSSTLSQDTTVLPSSSSPTFSQVPQISQDNTLIKVDTYLQDTTALPSSSSPPTTHKTSACPKQDDPSTELALTLTDAEALDRLLTLSIKVGMDKFIHYRACHDEDVIDPDNPEGSQICRLYRRLRTTLLTRRDTTEKDSSSRRTFDSLALPQQTRQNRRDETYLYLPQVTPTMISAETFSKFLKDREKVRLTEEKERKRKLAAEKKERRKKELLEGKKGKDKMKQEKERKEKERKEKERKEKERKKKERDNQSSQVREESEKEKDGAH